MSKTKTIKTRIVLKHDTADNWNKAVNFIPLKGEIIIYDDEHKIKIGDGVTLVKNLAYLTAENTSTVLNTATISSYSANGSPSTPNKTLQLYSGMEGFTRGALILVYFSQANTCNNVNLILKGNSYPLCDLESQSTTPVLTKIQPMTCMLLYFNGQVFIWLNPPSESTSSVGEPGGYYTPNVSTNGDLTWTPSKSTMPAAPSAKIMGPAGKTPVKGADYWTASDKQEIITEVLQSLPISTIHTGPNPPSNTLGVDGDIYLVTQ